MCTAGREFYALAWVLAQASKAIAQTLAQIPDTSTAAVVIPDVPGLPSARMYEVRASIWPGRSLRQLLHAWVVHYCTEKCYNPCTQGGSNCICFVKISIS